MAELSGVLMRVINSNLYADYDKLTLVLMWRWEVMLECGKVLTGLEDSRAMALAKISKFDRR
jgi:hypothetical protein